MFQKMNFFVLGLALIGIMSLNLSGYLFQTQKIASYDLGSDEEVVLVSNFEGQMNESFSGPSAAIPATTIIVAAVLYATPVVAISLAGKCSAKVSISESVLQSVKLNNESDLLLAQLDK